MYWAGTIMISMLIVTSLGTNTTHSEERREHILYMCVFEAVITFC